MEELRRAIGEAGSQTLFARAHGIAKSYLSDILAGRREIGPAVYKALGFERVVEYVRVR